MCPGLFADDGGLDADPPPDAAHRLPATTTMSTMLPMNHRRLR